MLHALPYALSLALLAPAAAAVIENPTLRVTLDPKAGTLTVRDKTARHTWMQAAGAALEDLRATPRTLEFRIGQLRVKLTLPPRGADLTFEADLPDRAAPLEPLPFLEPFVLDSPDAALVVADYSNGHLYPLDLSPFPKKRLSVTNLDMPWVGVCDLRTGLGYAVVVETPDDAYFEMRPVERRGRLLALPRLGWLPSKGALRYPRRCFYHFTARGGYVALAKRYRAYAATLGLIVPFAEKLKKNPNLARLFGAPDVWGDGTLKLAREAKAAGVEKMIIHTSPSVARRAGVTPEDMQALNELGYLTSTYDNYTDILPLEPGKEVDNTHDLLPDHAVERADGTRMPAWLTWDKKQFMKRCPSFWVPTAKVVVPKDLARYPYLGRFIDVTTAEDLYECYDVRHPLTRTDKRRQGVELLSYVRSLGLATGGEHGRWWAVPHLDYIEGMMSGGSYSWPAGHLTRPKTKDQQFTSPWGTKYARWEDYEKWGLGHQYRIPLWELVFHDCIVSTWYWGDASDFLLEAAPETIAKKDAFNVLYGTIPLLWANKQGSWQAARETFLRTCRVTSKLHEAIAGTEMLSHEFLTPDRAVQRTRFSDGTEVVVNFGEQPFRAALSGRDYLLPQNGFAVRGPRIEQFFELVDGRPLLTIRPRT